MTRRPCEVERWVSGCSPAAVFKEGTPPILRIRDSAARSSSRVLTPGITRERKVPAAVPLDDLRPDPGAHRAVVGVHVGDQPNGGNLPGPLVTLG